MVINRVKELLGKKRANEDDQYDAPPRQTLAAPAPPQSAAQISKPAPANGAAAGDSGAGLSLDDYFDQLDAAFSNLQPGGQTAEAVHEEIDWAAAMAPAAAAYAPVETSGASTSRLALPPTRRAQRRTRRGQAAHKTVEVARLRRLSRQSPPPPIAPVAPST